MQAGNEHEHHKHTVFLDAGGNEGPHEGCLWRDVRAVCNIGETAHHRMGIWPVRVYLQFCTEWRVCSREWCVMCFGLTMSKDIQHADDCRDAEKSAHPQAEAVKQSHGILSACHTDPQ